MNIEKSKLLAWCEWGNEMHKIYYNYPFWNCNIFFSSAELGNSYHLPLLIPCKLHHNLAGTGTFWWITRWNLDGSKRKNETNNQTWGNLNKSTFGHTTVTSCSVKMNVNTTMQAETSGDLTWQFTFQYNVEKDIPDTRRQVSKRTRYV